MRWFVYYIIFTPTAGPLRFCTFMSHYNSRMVSSLALNSSHLNVMISDEQSNLTNLHVNINNVDNSISTSRTYTCTFHNKFEIFK